MTSALRLPGFEDYPPDSPRSPSRRRSRQPVLHEAFVNETLPDALGEVAITASGADEAAGVPSGVIEATGDAAVSDIGPEPSPDTAPPPASDDPPFSVEVVRSARRKRTVGAQLVGGVLRITVPSWMNEQDTDTFVGDFVTKFRRKLRTDRVELPQRAAALAERYGLQVPTEIRWVGDMTTRWASCTASTGVIRMSSRLAVFPPWVLDYVIVHELAHLTEPNHSRRFWKLVKAYPLTERATGYLIAKSGDAEDEF